MLLSKRLSKVLDYIDKDDLVADIGADHGYLSLEMLNIGVRFVQVVENKIEPLKRAQLTLKNHENVKYSLSDGISDLDELINTVTICGMGGLNIVEILSNNLPTAKRLKKIILQANSKIFELREFLNNNSFQIIDEAIIEEKGCFYEIIVAKYEENKVINLSYPEKYFGPFLLKSQNETFCNKYKKKRDEYKHILKSSISKETEINNLKIQIELIETHVKGDWNA